MGAESSCVGRISMGRQGHTHMATGRNAKRMLAQHTLGEEPRTWTDVSCKHVADGAAGNAEKRTAGQAVEKACDEHGLDVARNCARNHEDEEEGEGANIDGPPAVELVVHVSACLFAVRTHRRVLANVVSDDGGRRTSDKGLKIIGPVPRPATNRLRPSVHTSRELWNSGISCE
jgi:hypothetical protein